MAPLLLSWPAAVTALLLAARAGRARGCRWPSRSVARGGPERRVAPPGLAAATAATVVLGLAGALLAPVPDGRGAQARLRSALGQDASTGRSAQSYTRRARGPAHPRAALGPAGAAPWTTPDRGCGGRRCSPAGTARAGCRAPAAADDVPPAGPVEQATVRVLADVGPLAVGRGPVRTVTLDGRTLAPQVADPDAVRLPDGTTGYSVVYARTDTAPPTGSGLPAEPADPVWLRTRGSQRIEALALTVTQGSPDPATRVARVQAWLRENGTYRLDSPVPAPGADAVEQFLFVDGVTGFCEQFASAEVLMLRALGTPARLVTGYADGAPDGRGGRVLRDQDAHAWVEAWYPGQGWVASDPTAGVPLAQGSARTLLGRGRARCGAGCWPGPRAGASGSGCCCWSASSPRRWCAPRSLRGAARLRSRPRRRDLRRAGPADPGGAAARRRAGAHRTQPLAHRDALPARAAPRGGPGDRRPPSRWSRPSCTARHP